MKSELIGHVGVDSGQLLLCDPSYIDSEWVKEDFEDIRVYENKITKDRLQYRVHFENYSNPIEKYNGKSMNDLIKTDQWESVSLDQEAINPFSYNACAKITLSEDGYGELKFNHGHVGAGVAFSTAFGDGMYPVIAHYMDDGTLRSVEVVFQDDDNEKEVEFKTFNEDPYGHD